MIRLQPTAISLSDAEVQTGLQRIMLRHTLITNLENLDIDCYYEYWDGETHEGSPSIDLESPEHQKDENRLNQTTSAPESDALQTSQANSTSILVGIALPFKFFYFISMWLCLGQSAIAPSSMGDRPLHQLTPH
jgi:hypothetical protein